MSPEVFIHDLQDQQGIHTWIVIDLPTRLLISAVAFIIARASSIMTLASLID